MTGDLLSLAYALAQRGEPFVLATVVRCERPTSAKPGAKALVRGDGSVTGWIGGACAEPTVVREALAALRDGQPRFISLLGEGGRSPGRTEGVREFPMTCHSGGTLEIYLEPVLPSPELVLIGHGPVLATLAELGRTSGFAIVSAAPDPAELERLTLTPRSYVVVATHGVGDEDALACALASPACYISLVASRRRAVVIAESLARRGIARDRIGAIKAPAGLDLGAVTPAEIAISILAEIVHVRHSRKPADPGERDEEFARTGTATDPICGMAVDIATARFHSQRGGRTIYFCCLRCKETFDR